MLGIPHVVVQFNIYELLKDRFSRELNKSKDHLPMEVIFFTSIISKGKGFNLFKLLQVVLHTRMKL